MIIVRSLLLLLLVGGVVAAYAESAPRPDAGDFGVDVQPPWDGGEGDPIPPDDGGEDGGMDVQEGVDLGPPDLGADDLGVRDLGVRDLGRRDLGASDLGESAFDGQGGGVTGPGLREREASCGCTSGRSSDRTPIWALVLFTLAIWIRRLSISARRLR